jgi:hypothetical protein
MRRSLLIVLLSLGVVAPAVGSTLGPDSASTRTPRVRIETSTPVEVIGTGFKVREKVRVTFSATQVWTKTVRATRAGRFDIVFADAHPDRCSGYSVIAHGARGSTASLKIVPMGCPPPARDPGA